MDAAVLELVKNLTTGYTAVFSLHDVLQHKIQCREKKREENHKNFQVPLTCSLFMFRHLF